MTNRFIPAQAEQDYIMSVRKHLEPKPELLATFDAACTKLLDQANIARKHRISSFGRAAVQQEEKAIVETFKKLVKAEPSLATSVNPKEIGEKITTIFTDIANPEKPAIDMEASTHAESRPSRRQAPTIRINPNSMSK